MAKICYSKLFTHTYTHTYAYTHTCTHAHTHTHTLTQEGMRSILPPFTSVKEDYSHSKSNMDKSTPTILDAGRALGGIYITTSVRRAPLVRTLHVWNMEASAFWRLLVLRFPQIW